MTNTTPKTRTPLWVKMALVVSLALNLAIAGVVAGFFLRGPGSARGAGPGVSFGLPYVIALEREDRRAVRDAIRSNPDLPDRRARRENYGEMLDLIRSDPLDTEALKVVIGRHVSMIGQVQSAAQAAWLQRLSSMSTEERVAYALRVEEVLRRGPDRKKKKSDRDD